MAEGKARLRKRLTRRAAWWTCDESAGIGPLYYIALGDRQPPPYTIQREVTAILDIADDGTLAGVELVHGDLPPPPRLTQEPDHD